MKTDRRMLRAFPFRPRRESVRVFLSVSALAAILLGCPSQSLFAASPGDEKLQADGTAMLREWLPPIYPPAALKERQSGMVTVRLIVDEGGHVTAARAIDEPDAAFVEAALNAVKSWQFTPAIEQGKAVPCCVDTLVTFSPAVGQQKKSAANIPPREQTITPSPRTSPTATVTPPGNYPDVLVSRQLRGAVRFACVVGSNGRATQPRVLAATHVDFVLRALESLKQWEFSPGMQGDLAVDAEIDGRMNFDSIVATPAAELAGSGIAAPDGSPPVITPEPLTMVDPVWPIDALLKGEAGSATVEFTVGESGGVNSVHVREASQPEFGAALLAAVETQAFERPIENNHTVTVPLVRRVEFKAVPLDATEESNPDARLVLALRRGDVGGAKGLDQKLAPIYRVRPEYPAALKENGAPAGHADIEFIVDREGRVRLPRIVVASKPEFGWAAATAIAQWVFTKPTRAGEPVDVKVKIPIDFTAPPS